MAPGQVIKQEWGERAAAKLAAAQERLAVEATALRSGEDRRRFVGFQAKLHVYSASNSTLIAVQHAEAFEQGLVGSVDPGYVAGFATWRALGRSVDRGQHGYMILAPCRTDRRVALDADGNARRLGWGEIAGDGERVESRRVVSGFRVEHVFSVQQTSGVPLPDQPLPQLLAGDAPPGLGAAVLELIESHGFSVDTVADADAIGGANDVTDWDSPSCHRRPAARGRRCDRRRPRRQPDVGPPALPGGGRASGGTGGGGAVRHDSAPGRAGSRGDSTSERRGVVVDITGRVGEVDRWRHWQIPRGAQAASCRQLAGHSEGEEGCRFDTGYPGADPGPEAA